MKFCPNCGNQLEDNAAFCPYCGANTATGEAQNPGYVPSAPVVSPYDHTAAFDAEDIRSNKIFAMIVYLLDMVGVAIALLAVKDSAFVLFHVKQSLKFTVCEVLLALLSAALVWTVIVPIVAAIAVLILMIVKLIAFFSVCQGKAQEPAIIRSIGFLQ